jgi:DNA mismatch endonuclease (patch repair protein)
MADIFDKKTRSKIMSSIRSKDTKPELLVRKFLFSKGFRFRVNDKKLPGKPDIVLPKYKTVIFVHGCFWHGHEDCKYFSLPKTRSEWWFEKIGKNKSRDKKNVSVLRKEKWKVIEIWECELKKGKERTLKKVVKKLK